MQDFTTTENVPRRLDQISIEDKRKFVDAFAWLIQEDKKQNPAFYQNNKKQNG